MKKLAGYFSLLIFAFLISCSPSNSVKIIHFEPEGEVDQLTTIKVEFDKDLATDEILGEWSDKEFIEFSPKIEGKFKWLNKSTLLFSPDVPLEPIQHYNARITNNVLFGGNFSPDFDEYSFHTKDFDVVKTELFWSQIPGQNYTLSIKANIAFNYPVSPGQLNKYLYIYDSDKNELKYEIVSEESADIIAVNIGNIKQKDKAQKIEIVVNEGLASVFGKKPLVENREFAEELPGITRLAITGVSSGFTGEQGWINVQTTQQVDENSLKNYVELSPGKDFHFTSNENSFRIEGDFSNYKETTLKIKKGLPGLYGGELEFEYEQVVTLVNLNPSINFTEKDGKYLMYSGNKNLEVNAVNVDEVEVEVSKIFKNNLVLFLSNYDYYYNNSWYNTLYYSPGDYGKIIYTEKIKLDEGQNWQKKFSVNLNKALDYKRFKGIYIVKVSSAEQRWLNDSRIAAVTDLAIIAKKYKSGMAVFVNSIATAKPVPNTKISILSTNNQVVLEGTTGEDGTVIFENIRNEIDGFTPRAVVAENGEDFNYLDLWETQIETSRFDVGGRIDNSSELNVFMYGDRNLYRPGETVNLSAILRDKNYNTVKDFPVILKIIDPRGKVFNKYSFKLNNEGSFEISFELPEFAQTGNYYAEVYTGSEELLSSYLFNVEEFVPDKIRVELKKENENQFPSETQKINVHSQFLSGAKASGLKYEAEIQFKPKRFVSKNFRDYKFANPQSEFTALQNVQMDGDLDEEGNTELSFTAPNVINEITVIGAYAYVSVFDLTGRTVNRLEQWNIYPNDYYLGIKTSGYYFGTNEKIPFRFAAVSFDDKPINNFKADVQLIRYQWQTVLKKDYSDRYFYASEKKEIVEWKRSEVLSKGELEIPITVSKSGKYELRISQQGSGEYNSVDFYAYGWGSDGGSSFQVDREGRIDIIADKNIYEPGETAKLLFSAPFSGKMLVSFERESVIDYQYVDVEGKSAEINIPIKEEYLPNVYVSAVLFKPHNSESSTPFLVGHGFQSIKVEKKNYKLPVTINAPEKIKPKNKVSIRVNSGSGKNVFVTLAAVDEGILQIKNYQTPDAYSFMYSKKQLAVDNYDLYKLLLPEIVQNSSPGGDALAAQFKKRVNPFSAKRFKLISFWSGIKKTNSNGEIEVELDIPQYNGEIRLMALAYSGKQFGSAEKAMKVSDDLIIQPQIPRVLSVGDILKSTVTVMNTTEKDKSIKLQIKTDDLLSVDGNKEVELEVPAKSSSSTEYSIQASNTPGVAKINFSIPGTNISENIEIAVRPISSLVSDYKTGTIKAGENVNLNLQQNFIDANYSSSLTISKFPALKFGDKLKYLIKYPHGCLEQTVSKLFPQLYFDELAKLVAPDMYKNGNPVYFLREGIKKIETMQIYDGSFTYWHGGQYINWWSTVYATHFLVEAQKAKYNVNKVVLQNALSFIHNKAQTKSTFDYRSYKGTMRSTIKIASKEILYSLYVLALAGEGDISLMNYYKARPNLLTEDGKYLLAGAYALMGKWNSFNELVSGEFELELTDRLTGGSFDSEVRSNSIILNVLLDTQPDNQNIPFLVKQISLMKDKMYSTQETAFALLALGKAASLNSNSDINLIVKAGGRQIAESKNSNLVVDLQKYKGKDIKLESSGTGSTYYFLAEQGIKTEGEVIEKDSNLKIRRSYSDYNSGAEITNNKFKQGQMIICKIKMSAFNVSVDNIAIIDKLPSCFEIENTRLGNTRSTVNNSSYQYLDIRDDRMNIYTDLYRNTDFEFSYLIRVVSKGKFNIPPISAEAMYSPEFSSVNGKGTISVSE